jgi:predicted permease
VVSEVALAMVAVVGTGVLVRNFYNARTLDPGMDAHNVVCAKYYVETLCRTREQRRQFCVRLAGRLRGMPGVAAVSYSSSVPLEFGESQDAEVVVEGYTPAAGEAMRMTNSSVSPGYFNLLGIPLLEGRDFREQDDRETAPVMIVNQSFARRFFRNRHVLGRKVRALGRSFTVIGLARDSKYRRLTEGGTPFFYTACRQLSGGEFWMAFFVRTNRPDGGAAAAFARQAAAVSPATRGTDFVPYQDSIDAALYPQRVAATLVGVVGAISLVLASIGLYRVLAFAVSRRAHEFGIRIALGARSWHVFSTMLRQGMVLTLAGLGAGTLSALLILKASSAFLPALRTDDPAIFAGSILLLSLVGFLASYLPARRATKVDPVVALRQE